MGTSSDNPGSPAVPASGRFTAWRRWALEGAVLLFLACAAVFQGQFTLAHWHGPASSLTNELYVPAAAMAAGRGFVNIIPESVPGFRQFLDFQQQSMDADLIRSQGKAQPLHPYQEYHRYLVTAVGWVWSLFGVSWDSMKILIILLFAVCLWEVYGISRLAMGVAASLAVALAFAGTETVTVTLALLRDFSKAPFILGAVLLLGWVVRRPRRLRWVWVFGLLTGLTLGVGLGFRRDAMVVLPFAVLVFLFAPLTGEKRSGRVLGRLAAVLLVVATFCASAWPVLESFHRYGSLAAHDTIMGFSTNSDRELSLRLASYEKLYILDDLYCSMVAYDAGRRGVTVDRQDYEKHYTEADYDETLKRRYVVDMAAHFPADMITRGYGAVLRILGGIWGAGFQPVNGPDVPPAVRALRAFHGLLNHAIPYGAWFALAALVCVSAVNWRLATAMLALVLFFGGYTSGQFSFRHAFHLEFAPCFFGLFLADHAVRLAVGRLRRRPGGADGRPFAFWAGAGRAGAWAVCAALLLGLPLWAAEAVQRAQVGRMADRMAHAEREPVKWRQSRWDDRVLLVPDVSDGCAACQNEGLLVGFRNAVYVADFAPGPDTPDVELCYEADDFTNRTSITLGPGDPCSMEYCFPVFETTKCDWWIQFAGIAVPEAQAARFRGFFRVTHPEELGFFVNMALPGDRDRMLWRQRIAWPWHGSQPPQIPGDNARGEFFQLESKARNLAAGGGWQEALSAWEAVAGRRPESRRAAIGRAEALYHLGRAGEALDALAEMLRQHPGDGLAVRLADESMARILAPGERRAAWEQLAARLPDDACVGRHARTSAGAPDGAGG